MAPAPRINLANAGPYQPTTAVKEYLRNHKCTAFLRARIPDDLSEYLDRLADESDKKRSALSCRLLLEAVMALRESGPRHLNEMKVAGTACASSKAKTERRSA